MVGGDRDKMNGAENIISYSDVGDDQLRSLYQSSAALLMPLTDATANNALLESLACGLPIISTDLPGTRDYLDNTESLLFKPGDVNGLVEAALTILNDSNRRRAMAASSRARARSLSWASIGEQTLALYQSL